MPRPLLFKIEVDDKGNPRVVRLTKNVQKLGKTTSKVGDIMKAALGSVAVIRAIAMLNQGIRQAVKNAAEFEANIRKISAITDTAGPNLASLADEARDLAEGTEHSANSITKAMLAISKMGFTTEQTMVAISDALNLSTVSGTDLVESATDMVTILKAFNLEADESGRVVDVIGTTVSKTALGFDDFREAMKFVAPIAKSLNISLEETAALMGAIGDVGLKGSIGGTTLKNMFLNLLKPTEKTSQFIENFNAEGKTFADILKEMKDSGLDVRDFLEQFNKRAVAGTLAIAGMSEKVNTLQDALEGGAKSMTEMADEIRDTTVIQFQRMLNVMNEIGLSIFDAFGERPQSVIEGIIDILQDLDGWVDDNQETISKWADAIVRTGGLLKDVLVPSVALLVNNLELLIGLGLAQKFIAWNTATTGAASALDLASGKVKTLTGRIKTLNLVTSSNLLLAAALVAGVTVNEVIKADKKLREELDKIRQDSIDAFNALDREKIAEEQRTQKQLQALDMARVAYEQFAAGIKDAKVIDDIIAAEAMFERLGLNIDTAADEQTKLNQVALEYARILGIVEDKEKKKGTGLELPGLTPEEIAKIIADRKKAIEDLEKQAHDLVLAEEENAEFFKDLKTKRIKAVLDRLIKKEEAEEDSAKKDKERAEETANFILDTAGQTFDVLNQLNDIQAQKEQKAFDKRMQQISRVHELEVAKAGDSAFLKQMAEEKFLQKRNQLEDEFERKRIERAKKQKIIAIAQAQIDTGRAILGALADTTGGAALRIASAISAGVFGAAQTALIAATPLRTGGLVGGEGNATSDSNLFRLSRGERVLSVEDVNRLGGNNRIQQMVDRGDTFNNSSVNVHIDTIIGTKEFVRDNIIPELEMEMSR